MLISNLRPGRLRAGPGVNAIVPRGGISQDSFQIADRTYGERGEAERGRKAAADDERIFRPHSFNDRREDQGSNWKEQDRAEAVHARNPPEHLPWYMALEQRVPQDLEADEREALRKGEEEDVRQRRDQPVSRNGDARKDRPDIHHQSGLAHRELSTQQSPADLAYPHGRPDSAVDASVRVENIADEERKRDDRGTGDPQVHKREDGDRDPEPRERESERDPRANLLQHGHRGPGLAQRRSREPQRDKAHKEACGVHCKGHRRSRDGDDESTDDRPGDSGGLER